MATNMIQYPKHAVAGSSKLKATECGHIYNLLCEDDIDNGYLVAKGDYVRPEVYKMKDSTGFQGVVLEKAANGNWYVEVTDPGDACLILTVPLIYEEYTTRMQQESNFYNAKGDIARAYELHKNDIFELSAEGFDGTPTKGATVTVVNKKAKI